jgi:hypothetical protein
MITGKVAGRPGTPFGAIDTGKDDEHGNHITIDPQQWTLMRRGLRLTGVNALATGLKEGQSAREIGGNMVRDSVGGMIHPYIGPMPRVLATLAGAPRPLGNAKPGGPSWENAGEAAKQLSPLSSSFFQGKERTGTNAGGVKGVLSSWGNAAGIKSARPFTNENAVYQMVDKFRDANGIKPRPSVGEADYRPLTDALRGTDKDSQKARLDELMQSKRPEELADYFTHFADHPFTGSKQEEAHFLKGLSPEDRQTYEAAVADRHATAQKGMAAVRDYFTAQDPNGAGKALADQASQKLAVNEGLRGIVEKLKAAGPEQRGTMLQALAQNPAIFKAVQNHLAGKDQELTPSDESIAAMRIENGARAKFIAAQARGMESGKRQEFLTHLAKTNLLNSKVLEQMSGP